MIPIQPASSSMPFSKEAIDHQLEQIFKDRFFIESEILKRFLVFIVDETLKGNANCLKEYTIAVNVLGKPIHFKPSENCIVRIHAGRLRRALNHYYHDKGADDFIHISIPKGQYVPLFSDKNWQNTNDAPSVHEIENELQNRARMDQSVVIAVLPFSHSQNNALLKSVSDGISMQLSTALMNIEHVGVIAHQAVKSLLNKSSDFMDIANAVGTDFIISGCIQSLKNRLRVNIQMIRTSNCEQIWGEMYERTIARTSVFDVQDEIVDHAISKLQDFWMQSAKTPVASMMAAV